MRLPKLPLVPEKASESMRGILYRKEKQWEQWSSRDGAIREASLVGQLIRDETDGHGLFWIFVAPHLPEFPGGHRATPSHLNRRKPVRSAVSFVSLLATRSFLATRITARERPRRSFFARAYNTSRPYRPYSPPRAPRAPRTFAVTKGAAEPVSRNYQHTGLPARSSNDPRTLADIRPRRR